MSIKTIIYPVTDLDAAKAVFTAALGVASAMDEPYYVGFSVDGQDIGLNPHGHRQGMTGPVAYVHVPDISATLGDLLAAGAAPEQDVTDVGGGKLLATVSDPDGNVVGLLQEA